MNSLIADQVIAFVAENTRNTRPLSLNMEIGDDLGIDGLDALELMEKFADRFEVDMTGFRFNAHFAPEGVGCLMPLSMLTVFIRRRIGKPVAKLIPITIADLVAVAASRKWLTSFQTQNSPS